MRHEAVQCVSISYFCPWRVPDFVIRSSIDLGSNMNVGRVTRLRSAPGRNWDMMWDRTVSADAELTNAVLLPLELIY